MDIEWSVYYCLLRQVAECDISREAKPNSNTLESSKGGLLMQDTQGREVEVGDIVVATYKCNEFTTTVEGEVTGIEGRTMFFGGIRKLTEPVSSIVPTEVVTLRPRLPREEGIIITFYDRGDMCCKPAIRDEFNTWRLIDSAGLGAKLDPRKMRDPKVIYDPKNA